MIKHYIIMSSSYTDGKRIALDITEEQKQSSGEIKKVISQIRESCGEDVALSTHIIQTEEAAWESVQAYDPFFDDVECVKTVDTFSRIIKSGRVLSGLDVATYILSKRKCTHLSLEKMVYFAYADYLCSFSEKLFEDKIYAFTYGPVIDSVYETYKRSGYKYVAHQDTGEGLRQDIDQMPIRSRILFAYNGANKLRSIERTLARYGDCNADELVKRTHRLGTPWSRIDSTKPYQEIPDEMIKKYYFVECED